VYNDGYEKFKRVVNMVINGHLTESKLGELLTHLYGKTDVKAQYKLEKYKIDFYVESINTYFEHM
jgi:hypothetical protein